MFNELFHNLGNANIEIVRLMYLISLLLSLFIYYKQEHSPGGIITAGSVILLISEPWKILILLLTTLLIIPIEILIEEKLLQKHILLSKDKILLRVAISIIITIIIYSTISKITGNFNMDILSTVSPALLATTLINPTRRMGSIKSFLLTIFLGIIIYIIIRAIYVYLVPEQYIHSLNQFYRHENDLDFYSVIILYIILFFITVYNYLMRRVKVLHPVGIMIGGYLGLFVLQPIDLLFILIVSTISILIVKVIDHFSLLFGYRTFVLASLISAIIYISLEILTIKYIGFHPLNSLVLAGIVICSVITSELTQHFTLKKIYSIFSIFLFSGFLFITSYFISKVIFKDNVPNVYKQYIEIRDF